MEQSDQELKELLAQVPFQVDLGFLRRMKIFFDFINELGSGKEEFGFIF